MASGLWPCERCHSLNVPGSDQCYSCRTRRPTQGPEPTGELVAQPEPLSSSGFRRRTAALIGALAITAGAFAGLVVVALSSVPRPAGEVAAATALPQLVVATPRRVAYGPPGPVPTPAPTPSPTPRFVPFLGRFSGTWLLEQELGQDAAAAGGYPSELLLRVRPTCDTGECAVSASLVNPRTGKVVAATIVKRTDEGYRIKMKASATVQCRGADGRSVKDGAKRTTSYVMRPFEPSAGGDMFLAAEGTIRLNPNRRGDSVACRDATFDVGINPDKLTKADLASVKGRLSAVPLPDLVPRPNFTVSIKGVRSIYYSVKGDGARKLMDRWSAASSKDRYCGRVDYDWASGSRETLSCIKSTWDPDLSYLQDPWTGACTVTGISLHWTMRMPIARWTGPSLVPRGLAKWWKATQRYVRDHEAGHVAIYRKWFPVLRKRIVGASCASGSSIMKKWSNQVNAAQEAFDRREYARTDWPPYPADAR